MLTMSNFRFIRRWTGDRRQRKCLWTERRQIPPQTQPRVGEDFEAVVAVQQSAVHVAEAQVGEHRQVRHVGQRQLVGLRLRRGSGRQQTDDRSNATARRSAVALSFTKPLST